MSTQPIRWISRRELCLLGGILLLSLLAWFLLGKPLQRSAQQYAEILLDGTCIAQIDLQRAENGSFTLPEVEDYVFLIQDGKIRIDMAPCPTQTCVHTGFLSHAGQTAVCVPNHVIVTIRAQNPTTEPEVDAVVG